MSTKQPSRRPHATSVSNVERSSAPPAEDTHTVLNADQLRRRRSRERFYGLEPPELEEPGDPVEDLLWVARLTPMPRVMRYAFEEWALGARPREIAAALSVSESTARRLIRSAMVRCWIMGPVPFGEMSARCIYRPPDTDGYRSPARCEVCAEPLWDDYDRSTCGRAECDAVLRQRRELDRRRFLKRDA